MKFLCVECDEPMKLQRTGGPDNGSMSVLFGCPSCGREVAMLTNAMETQMVRSLGVKIGAGGGSASAPMGTIRESLVSGSGNDHGAGAQVGGSNPASEAASGKGPAESGDVPLDHAPDHPDGAESGGKCPFTGMVNDAFAGAELTDGELVWTAEALERLERIPSYVRSMVEKGIVEYAKETGVTEIDGDFMDAARGRFGM
ncbi:MAG: PCP reductase family protein [Rhodothermia bacterium]|nr:PCP reductase family protein [Rhodothermia bacterium]